MATSTKTRTSVKTKVAIAIASGAVLAAAAAGVYQVDKKSYTKETAPRQEIVQEVQKSSFSLRGPIAGLYSASVSFKTTVDIPAKANIMVLMPEGLSVDRATVTVDGSLIGEYFLSQQGRVVVINRDGNGAVIKEGKTIQMLVGKIAVVDSKIFSPDGAATVAIQYLEPAKKLPDFGVSDIYLEGDIVTIILQNQGVDSDLQNMQISIESDGDMNRTYTTKTLADQRFLIGNSFSKLQPGAIKETTTIKVCIDSNQVAEELNEGNNCLKKKLDVKESIAQDAADLPDEVKAPESDVAADDAAGSDVANDGSASDDSGSDVSADDGKKIPEIKQDQDNDGDIATTGVLEVLSPNGGEVVTVGDTIEIRWKGDSERVREVALGLMDDDDQIGFFEKGISIKDGSYKWQIPEDIRARKARIRIVGYDVKTKQTVEDLSDKWFEITYKIAKEDEDNDRLNNREDDTDRLKGDVEDKSDAGDTAEDGSDTSGDPADGSDADSGTTSGGTSSGDVVRRGGSGGGSGNGSSGTGAFTLGYDNLIKLQCPTAATYDLNHPCRTVYYYSTLGTRHAFPNSKVFFTWYSGFGDVKIISKDTMASIPLGQNVTYRPGTRMVKFQTADVVYTVNRGGVLRAVETEQLAGQLYGIAWNTKIDDINDAFYTDYGFGAPLITSGDFSASAAIQSVQSINDSL
ncbi:hypothetical protein HQ524_02560 [Candidatus Uhrbacteria bacterium]|nr:hypothetical protein [Candidatus Uhrbacteria bacterium]